MKHFSSCKANRYLSYISDNNLPFPQHQISTSFTDGMYGDAYVHLFNSAITVGDFVELIGSFDEEIYKKIIEPKEVHLMAPPATWKKALEKRFSGKISEYTRVSFHPMVATFAAKAATAFKKEKKLSIEGYPVEIKPIEKKLLPVLLEEEWSSDVVANTMVNNKKDFQGFGFVAGIGTKIIGGIGCYTLYRNGIEIEIDTQAEYRRRGIATLLSLRMLEECGRRNLACHWDAMNIASASLAKKLGFIEKSQYSCTMLSRS